MLKSHQLHQSQTLKSPVQTILQPNQTDITQIDSRIAKATDSSTQQHQPPPKRLLQNFVTPTPTPPTPPMPRTKKEPMTVKFESIGGNREEKVTTFVTRRCF